MPPHFRRNFALFLVDYVGFGIAFNFFNPNSVLPAFASRLTDSNLLIGLVGAVFNGCWLLPQLATGRLIKDKPRKKPYLLAGLSSRVLFWALALALWFGMGRNAMAALIALYACIGLWAILDGIASVAWFDIIARAVPLQQRARLMSLAQIIGGLGGTGAGALIGLILERYSFPNDYALIFAVAGAILIPSSVALALVREPPPKGGDAQPEDRPADNWLQPLRTDPAFRRLMVCRLLIGMIGLATPFYVKHAEQKLLLPQSIVGYFVIAQTLAGVVASAVLGQVSERWGTHIVAWIGSGVAALGPLFALVADLVGGGWLVRAYPFVYAALGILTNAYMLGFFNYLLGIAPEGRRTTYIGLGNTLMGVLTLVPMAGGWLLKTTSYAALFGTTTALVAAGFLISLGLKPLRQVAPAETEP
jgi:MFS family permease